MWWYHVWTVKNTKISWNLILAGWHRKNMIYFRLCFSFSCSGYYFTLIKKCHTLNSYSFLQKFLLKTKAYKLIVDNWKLNLLLKNNKLRKSFLLLPLTSCSINKLTCYSHVKTWQKFYVFRLNVEKKLAPGIGCWRPAPSCLPPLSLRPFILVMYINGAF